jgi:hypothetical protein
LLSKVFIKNPISIKIISQIRDFLNPISGSSIPLPGNVSHIRDFIISHYRESYP